MRSNKASREYFNTAIENAVLDTRREYRTGSYVAWGQDNFTPYKLLDLYLENPFNSSLIDKKAQDTVGVPTVQGNVTAYMEGGGTDPIEVFRQCTVHWYMFGAMAFRIDYAQDGTPYVDALSPATVRKAAEAQDLSLYYKKEWRPGVHCYSSAVARIPLLDSEEEAPVKAYWTERPSPVPSTYPFPEYIGAVRSIQNYIRADKYEASSYVNGMYPGLVIRLPEPGGDKDELVNRMTDQYAGCVNAKVPFVIFGQESEVTTLDPSVANTDIREVKKAYIAEILAGHRCPSPSLVGMEVQTGFTSSADMLVAARMEWERSVITPNRDFILKELNGLYARLGTDIKIDAASL